MAETASDFDPTKSFESYVVGSANRLAAAAARRAAETPGASYNPLFLYSQSGLGKSHILNAIGLHLESRKYDVRYLTLEGFLQELEAALARGGGETMRARYRGARMLLLDDVQFVAGQTQAQELLLGMMDDMAGGGSQVVLASDRPPTEIDGLDARLLARFSSGLIVDIGQPDYETRVAIVKMKAGERNVTLAEGIPETLARLRFRNVRDLQGALNRVLADQDLKGRALREGDVMALMAELASGLRPATRSPADDGPTATKPPVARPTLERAAPAHGASKSGAGPGPTASSDLDEDEVDDGAPWRTKVKRLAEAARANSVEAAPLVELLTQESPPDDWKGTLSTFDANLRRIREIRAELDRLDNPWPEAAATFLTTTERLNEAENLLMSARELRRPLLPLPEGPRLESIKGKYPALALKAADQLIRGGPSPYNPLFVYSPEPRRALGLLRSAGRSFLALQPEKVVGSTSLSAFADDFIRAMTEGVAGAWRERWWGIDMLLLHELEGLSSTERVQDELFHLFEALTRRGGRIILAADRHPDGIESVDVRLASRFQGGLVLDLGETPGGAATLPAPPEVDAPAAVEEASSEAPAMSGAAKPDDAEAEVAEAEEAGPEAPEPEESPESATTQEKTPSDEREPSPATPGAPAQRTDAAAAVEWTGVETPNDDLAAVRELAGLGVSIATGAAGGAEGKRAWKPSPEKVVWNWPDVEALIADHVHPLRGEVDNGD